MANNAQPEVMHTAVMVAEVLAALKPNSGGSYLDATLGDGGHSHAILSASSPKSQLCGLDIDPKAVTTATKVLHEFKNRISLFNLNYASDEVPAGPFDGIILDLGVSSRQFDDPVRGFSLRQPGPLDMRMDPGSNFTLADLLTISTEKELADIIFNYGEEKRSRPIAAAIKQAWAAGLITDTVSLAKVIADAAPTRNWRIHPATRSFQAFRIAVNRELDSLTHGLPNLENRLKESGVMVVISYHSLEDRIVKRFFAQKNKWELLYKKPLVPARQEILQNRRARSAKLRAARKVG
jgi:16S rRNA (cytosine1402-N4)-methyltransferase